MNYPISEKNNFVVKLTEDFTPPSNPKYIVDESLKEKFEKQVGVNLPNDYYDYINAFGYGSFSDYVRISNPFAPEGYDEYFYDVEDNRQIYADMMGIRKSYGGTNSIAVPTGSGNFKIISESNDELQHFEMLSDNDLIYKKLVCCGYGFPYDFYENGVGLIYFGRTDDYNFFWNYKNEGYTIVMYCDGDEFYEYDLSFSEFLYDFLNGKLVNSISIDEPFEYIEYKDMV